MNIKSVNNSCIVHNNPEPQQVQSTKTNSSPSFGAKFELSKGQADAIAAQHIAAQNLQNKCPIIKEENINLGVTCCGFSNVKGNKRELNDYRCAMSAVYGYNWSDTFLKPMLVRNQNLDERKNGQSTAIVIPLNSKTPCLRGADNAVIMLDGDIPTKIAAKLVEHLLAKGILVRNPQSKMITLSSTKPYELFSHPQFKKIIVQFFDNELKQNGAESCKTEFRQGQPLKREPINIGVNDINLSSIGYNLHSQNTRPLADYRSTFLANNRQFTVLHEKVQDKGVLKDMTVMLIGSKKDAWDCYTIAIDAKVSRDDCVNMINYLIKNDIDIDDDNCKSAIVDYFKNLK